MLKIWRNAIEIAGNTLRDQASISIVEIGSLWLQSRPHLVSRNEGHLVGEKRLKGTIWIQKRIFFFFCAKNSTGAVVKNDLYCAQSYKQFTIVIYKSRVVIWAIFSSRVVIYNCRVVIRLATGCQCYKILMGGIPP